ncbi:MAG: PAS domain-containing sensor histidine kinase, partial [Methanobacteriales archaeon HGW-Methanobacteriales-2]
MDAIINCSPLPQFVIDSDHKVVYWNRALEEYSKLNATDILGTDNHWKAFYNSKRPCMVDLLVDEDIDGLAYWFLDNYKMSELVEGAYEGEHFSPHMGKGGKYLHFTASAIKDHEGNVIGGLESFEDITQRKIAENDLQESEEKFRSLVENLNVGVYRNTVDLGGYFIQVNPAFARMFGYESTSEIMETKVIDFFLDPSERITFLEDLK